MVGCGGGAEYCAGNRNEPYIGGGLNKTRTTHSKPPFLVPRSAATTHYGTRFSCELHRFSEPSGNLEEQKAIFIVQFLRFLTQRASSTYRSGSQIACELYPFLQISGNNEVDSV